MNRKWKKQLCWEGFMAGIWALCHIKIRGTVIRFEKALWRITSLKKKRHTVIVSDCFEIANCQSANFSRSQIWTLPKCGPDFETDPILPSHWETPAWIRCTVSVRRGSMWWMFVPQCLLIWSYIPARPLDPQELLMSSTNHPSPAVSNSLFYSKTAITVSCGVVHNTHRFMFSHLYVLMEPLW